MTFKGNHLTPLPGKNPAADYFNRGRVFEDFYDVIKMLLKLCKIIFESMKYLIK